MNLGEMRQYVRDVLEVDSEDLPESILDASVAEGYERVLSHSTKWPWLAGEWDVVTDPESATVDLASTGVTVRDIASMSVGATPLTAMEEVMAARRFSSDRGVPVAWSRWGDTVRLWPCPDSVVTVSIRGWRRHRPFTSASGWEPDLPLELHSLLTDWALANEYQRQEDVEMMTSYRMKFADQINILQERTLTTAPSTPLVVGSAGLSDRWR